MTGKEIKRAKMTLPNPINVPWKDWTDEQKQLDNELACRDIINSVLIYDGPNGLADNEYIAKYIKELGKETVDRLCKEQLADFKQALVIKDVRRDGEGMSYNSIKWADELSLGEKLSIANSRSQNIDENNLKVDILQLKDNDETRNLRFSWISHLKDGVNSVKASNYLNVYSYNVDENIDFANETDLMALCEDVYMKFNINHPKDFTGHSLSISDVVVFSKNSESKAFYCDSFGWKELPEKFVEDLKVDKNKDGVEFEKE